MGFKKATKEQSKLRLAIFGPTGSGKTYTSLSIGVGMAEAIGGKVALIDSEKGSASKYSGFFDFDTLELVDRVHRAPNSPPIFDKSIEGYVDAMREAAKNKYDVLIIDSGSHAWQELLEDIDRLTETKYKGNSFRAWSEGTPKQKHFVNAILGYPGHIIMTMRSKMEYSLERDKDGRTKVNKLGLSPEQGKAIEYEFDQLMEITTGHFATITKDRTSKFQDQVIDRPGKEFGKEMIEWLNEGSAPIKQNSIPNRMTTHNSLPKPEPVQAPKGETQTVFQSGESTFEIIDPQPIIEQPKKEKKSKFTPAKILETLEAEIYTSRMSEDALLALDQLKERWEKKRDTLVQAGVFDLGLQKIKTTIKELKNES